MNKYLLIQNSGIFLDRKFEENYYTTPYYQVDTIGLNTIPDLYTYLNESHDYKSVIFYNPFEGLSFMIRELTRKTETSRKFIDYEKLNEFEKGFLCFFNESMMYDRHGIFHHNSQTHEFNFLNITVPFYWAYTYNFICDKTRAPNEFNTYPSLYPQLKEFKYNLMLGNPSPPKSSLYFHMKRLGLFDDGIVSFNNTRRNKKIDINRVLFFDEKDKEVFSETENVPMKYGDWRFKHSYPDEGTTVPSGEEIPSFLGYDIEVFVKSYFGVVCESFNSDLNFGTMVSEKTFSCICNGLPFIVFGERGCIRMIRQAGYDVFDDIIDHNYDEIYDYRERGKSVVESVKKALELDWEKVLPTIKERLTNNIKLYDTKRESYNYEIKKHFDTNATTRDEFISKVGLDRLENFHRTYKSGEFSNDVISQFNMEL